MRSETGQTVASTSNPCDFTLAQPCPQQPSGVLSIDTRRVADGPHTFSLVVVDAAGNTQSLTSPPLLVRNAAAAPPAPPPGPPASTPAAKTKITAVIKGRRLRVSGPITRSGRVRVSWRSKRRGRTVAHGSRVVTIRNHKVSVTFVLSKRARDRDDPRRDPLGTAHRRASPSSPHDVANRPACARPTGCRGARGR